MKILLQDIWELIRDTFKKAIDDEIMTYGAAIAFYTIFSIAPLFILMVALGGIFLSEEMISGQIESFLGGFLDQSMIDNLNNFIEQRTEGTAGFFTTLVALAAIIFGATTVISQLKMTLNKIWNVRELKMNSIWNFMFNRLLSFGMIILFSFLLIASLIAEAVFGIMGTFFREMVLDLPFDLFVIISQFGTVGFAVLFFTLIFKILPDVHARWTDVAVGAIVTTVLFLLGKYLIGIYFSASGIEVAYRAAGSLVVFVVWVYYNIQTILLGAVFTQVYTEKYGGQILPYKFAVMEGVPSIERRDEPPPKP